jgi:hypothetical protein
LSLEPISTAEALERLKAALALDVMVPADLARYGDGINDQI